MATSRAKSSAFPGAERFLPSERTLTSLETAARGCQGCELYRDAEQTVFGEGAPTAPLVLVGEQPGDQEDRQGQPFVGPAGQLLVRALAAAEISPDLVFRTNVVKHFRYELRGRRRMHVTPDLSHMVACSPWLEAELSVVQPEGVVVLGATAGRAIFGSRFRVGEMRGAVHAWPDEALITPSPPPSWLVATTHPSAVLRAREREPAFDALVADLELVATTLRTGAG